MVPPEKRRPQGTGSLFQRKSDGLWVARVEAGYDAKGNRRHIQRTAKNRTDAARKLRDVQREVAAGDIGPDTSSRLTVARWAEQWLPMHEAVVRPKVYVTDKGTVRKWIVPTLGRRKLAELGPADTRALRSAIIAAGRSSTTAHHAHTILSKMLKDAVREGHHVPPRLFLAEKPRKAVNDRQAIPLDQALQLLAAIGQREDASRWLYGMYYGLRQGEVLGLDWSHVDLNVPEVHVEWQLQRLPKEHTLPDGFRARHLVGPMWQTETKTGAGQRRLPLVPIVAASLAAAHATWEANPWGLVWTHDGQPVRAERDRAQWKVIQAEAGVAHPSGRAWHVHECRHTIATLLVRQGTDRSVVQRILGQTRLVESYLHADSADLSAALEGIARQLEG